LNPQNRIDKEEKLVPHKSSVTIFGIEIGLQYSWLIIVLLIAF
jgi:hypothetical protein